MKESVICPSCESSFRVSRANEGKRAKCPKCKSPFVISFATALEPVGTIHDFSPHTTPPPIASSPIPTQASRKPKQKSTLSTKRKFSLPQWAIIALPAIATLVLGYFAGREHLKYQMRSALTDVAQAFSEGFGGANSPTATLGSTQSSAAESVAEPLPQLVIGKTHQADGFDMTLVTAKIATSKVKDMMGDIGTGKNPDLALSFTFTNTDDRKILRFRKGNQFMAGHFRLRDDVDNVIRGINYGMTSKPVGALTGSEDIAPGANASHIELFSVPPPKTEFLILTVNLACLGGDGEIEYKIPASSITR